MTENTVLWDKLSARVERNVQRDPNSGCWLWSGYLHKNGYATMKLGDGSGRGMMAHRVSYICFAGEIPDGKVLDHKCKTRCCVNPAHLEPVTYRENNLRSPRLKPLKSHCKNGHLLAGENLYPSKWRRCAECARRQALASFHKRKTR